MRIAIVHDWLVTYAGAERVLEQMLDCYPDADLFSVIDFIAPNSRDFLKNKHVTTSFIQHLPMSRTKYRSYLPLMPMAVERFDLSDYDLIISSSHAVAKGVITRPDQLHICYLQARNLKYAYDDRNIYSGSGMIKFLQDAFLVGIRIWDDVATKRPNITISNSHYVASWHYHRHQISCSVIYPPVDITQFSNNFSEKKDNFYVAVGRIEPYKRFDLIVDAFNQIGAQIKIIGNGTEYKRLKLLSNSNIEWLGYQDSSQIAEVLSRAKAFVFASREDFGIAPLEAQASGTPVIAYGRGGACETVRGLDEADHPTGLFFHEQSASAVVNAVERFEREGNHIAPEDCRENAKYFSRENFRGKFTEFIDHQWQLFQENKHL